MGIVIRLDQYRRGAENAPTDVARLLYVDGGMMLYPSFREGG